MWSNFEIVLAFVAAAIVALACSSLTLCAVGAVILRSSKLRRAWGHYAHQLLGVALISIGTETCKLIWDSFKVGHFPLILSWLSYLASMALLVVIAWPMSTAFYSALTDFIVERKQKENSSGYEAKRSFLARV